MIFKRTPTGLYNFILDQLRHIYLQHYINRFISRPHSRWNPWGRERQCGCKCRAYVHHAGGVRSRNSGLCVSYNIHYILGGGGVTLYVLLMWRLFTTYYALTIKWYKNTNKLQNVRIEPTLYNNMYSKQTMFTSGTTSTTFMVGYVNMFTNRHRVWTNRVRVGL